MVMNRTAINFHPAFAVPSPTRQLATIKPNDSIQKIVFCFVGVFKLVFVFNFVLATFYYAEAIEHGRFLNATVNSTHQSSQDAQASNRSKRQYGYEDNYYSSFYGWQAGRLIGWVLGFICLMLFICVPCICCIGIWFAGWFGLRQAMARRNRSAEVIESRRGRYNRDYVEQPAPLEVPTGERYIYAQASDRFYERRPRTPPREPRR